MFSIRTLHKPISLVLVLAALAYPLTVYVSLGEEWQRWTALLLAVLAAARAFISKEPFWWWVAGGAAALFAGSQFRGDTELLKLYPVLVNVVMLASFSFSLWRPPSVVERLARISEPDLPDEGVRYTETVTKVWCVFFVLNGCMALYTALFTDERLWALYNGLVAYGLMGCLMLGERLVRARVRAGISMRGAP